jgi:hypothetical protein
MDADAVVALAMRIDRASFKARSTWDIRWWSIGSANSLQRPGT